MPTRYAVLDLETTGPSYRNGDRIIQVGIVIWEQGQHIDTYDTLIKPKTDIPTHITDLTGITPNDVKDAPQFSDVANTIWGKLQNTVIVAHNIQFDYGFINHAFQAEGFPSLNQDAIDTVELIRVLYPRATSYKLQEFAEAMNIPLDHAHSAIDDAMATMHVLELAIAKVQQLSKQTFKKIQPFLSAFVRETGKYIVHWYEERFNHPVTPSFGASQIAPSFLKAVDLRPIQEKMIEDLSKSEQTDIFLEAPSGTGKTLASIVGIMQKNKGNILFSTTNTLLQYQISEDTVPLLESFLGRSLSAVVVKSANHYISQAIFNLLIRQMMTQLSQESKQDMMIAMSILVWIEETETGDFYELHHGLYSKEFWQRYWKLASTELSSEQLMIDFYGRQLERARDAELVITNHAYLLQHPNILVDLNCHHLIMDECHQLFLNSGWFALESFDSWLYQSKYKQVDRIFNQFSDWLLRNKISHKMSDRYYEVQLSYQNMIATLAAFEDALDTEYGHLAYYQQTAAPEIYIAYEKSVQMQWLDYLRVAVKAVTEFSKGFGQLLGKNRQFLQSETYNSWIQAVQLLINENEKVFTTIALTSDDYLAIEVNETSYRINRKTYSLLDRLNKIVEAPMINRIWMSASLNYFMNERQIPKELTINHFDYFQYTSEYNYSEQLPAFVISGQPSIDKLSQTNSSERIAELIAEQLPQVITQQVKVHIVFQSRSLLEETYQKLINILHSEEKQYIYPQLSGRNRQKIHDQYNRATSGFLLALQSFNEGVHFTTNSDIYILTRLPFPHPDRADQKAKQDMASYYKENYFTKYALPQMMISLNQMIGRCLQSTEDSAILISLDQRILKSAYATLIQKYLPTGLNFQWLPIESVTDVFDIRKDATYDKENN